MSASSSSNRRPSIRELAEAAGVSPITASRAMRGSPLVREELREQVQRVARKIGYVRNPLAGALMSEIRRAQGGAFHGVLAVLDIDGLSERAKGAASYHAELTRGAKERAAKLGFSIDAITVGDEGISLGRLQQILRTRGVSGLFLLPVRTLPDLTRLDWAQFSGVYADYLIERPGLHSVCPDHYRGMLLALEHVRALGYRRPGLVLSAFHNARLLHRMSSAFHAYQTTHEDTEYCTPLLFWRPNREDFLAWFRASKCDVVISHISEPFVWMKEAGARVPETHGFCLLNLQNSEEPCAGLNLQPRLVGQRGIELLIGMVLRNERGAPEEPLTTHVPAKWVDGPTLRDVRSEGGSVPLSGVWKWAPPPGRKEGEYPVGAANVWPWIPGERPRAKAGSKRVAKKNLAP